VFTLFAADAVPTQITDPDTVPVELGVKFVPAQSGSVLGVRFYRGPSNTGAHPVTLWSSTGTKLATVTVPSSTVVGWQVGYFTSPVAVTAGTTYVVSYFAPNGGYSGDNQFFTSTWTNGPLSAPAGSNGVYRYASSSTFPNQSYQSSNYWVDPLFTPATGAAAEGLIADGIAAQSAAALSGPAPEEIGLGAQTAGVGPAPARTTVPKRAPWRPGRRRMRRRRTTG